MLDEKLFYTDGITEQRVWNILIRDDGHFSAESDSLNGSALGHLSGNTLFMKYSTRVKIAENKHWNLDMRDLMILQPDGALHNITQVCKWGIRLGTVSTQYQQHNGDHRFADTARQA